MFGTLEDAKRYVLSGVMTGADAERQLFWAVVAKKCDVGLEVHGSTQVVPTIESMVDVVLTGDEVDEYIKLHRSVGTSVRLCDIYGSMQNLGSARTLGIDPVTFIPSSPGRPKRLYFTAAEKGLGYIVADPTMPPTKIKRMLKSGGELPLHGSANSGVVSHTATTVIEAANLFKSYIPEREGRLVITGHDRD